jgi:hypothetical protein
MTNKEIEIALNNARFDLDLLNAYYEALKLHKKTYLEVKK